MIRNVILFSINLCFQNNTVYVGKQSIFIFSFCLNDSFSFKMLNQTENWLIIDNLYITFNQLNRYFKQLVIGWCYLFQRLNDDCLYEID